MRSLYDVHQEAMEKYGTENNTFNEFAIGDRVKVITPYCDSSFFHEETGVVDRNSHSYLGITVKFDKPREFKDGHIQLSFNFNPKDLYNIERQYKTCECCNGIGKILKEK